MKSIVDVLLDARASLDELTRAASDLYDCLSAPIALTASAPTQLSNGLALAPMDAAECVKDPIRTAMFLRGVHDALRAFAGETIEVAYAGTGPLAPLAIPLMPRFPNARFTLIDVHAQSIEAARRVAGHFGVSAEFVIADATAYEHRRPIHIAITETMQRALGREPHVAVVRQLARQLVRGGILVPESVRVSLALDGVSAATLLDVRKDIPQCLDAVRVAVPAHASAAYSTVITTYGSHVIREFESGLTHDEPLWDLPRDAGLEFRYRIERNPGFEWRAAP
jgi:hypothetical protein